MLQISNYQEHYALLQIIRGYSQTYRKLIIQRNRIQQLEKEKELLIKNYKNLWMQHLATQIQNLDLRNQTRFQREHFEIEEIRRRVEENNQTSIALNLHRAGHINFLRRIINKILGVWQAMTTSFFFSSYDYFPH
jgi:hypothetical protein